MKTVISKYIALSLLIIGFGGYCQAETVTKLPTSDQVEKVKKVDKKVDASKDETLPSMKLKVEESTQSSNPKLKKGKGCENLEELRGDTFNDYPMAETISCDKVDCKDLKSASLQEYKFKELPTAKTSGSCEE